MPQAARASAVHVHVRVARDAVNQLGLAKGIPFSFDDPVPFVTDFARRVGTAKPSMLQDHQAQRRSEIHAINGAIARLGREMGYETPYNTTLSEIILAHEAKFKD